MLPLCLLAADQKLLHPGNYGMKLCGCGTMYPNISVRMRSSPASGTKSVKVNSLSPVPRSRGEIFLLHNLLYGTLHVSSIIL